jgi:D-glycero-D-manno-heptose 1,7-bisphosphate phosphatase
MIEQAVVLCGGRGAGPEPPTTDAPLLPVAGAPFLDALLFELGRHGFRAISSMPGTPGTSRGRAAR